MMLWMACILGAYVIGSIPVGVIIGHTKGIDIRQHGSRNIGATNVGRVLGKRLGALCFALDFLKGAGPVIISGIIGGVLGSRPESISAVHMWLWLAVALATVVGHMFSLFLGFRGGKGVATGFGAMMALWPLLTLPTLGAIAVWYGALRLTKYVSIASIAAVTSLPIFYLLSVIPREAFSQPPAQTINALVHASPPFIATALIAALVIYQHRGNLSRLRRGIEPKVGSGEP